MVLKGWDPALFSFKKVTTYMKKNAVAKSNVVRKPVAKRIGKTKAADMVLASNGRMFTAIYIKKGGKERSLTGRLGVTKYLSNSPKKRATPSRANLGYVSVYDMLKKDYVTLNLQTITGLKINGETYRIS